MQTQVIKQYLFKHYQDDLDLKAFVDAFNTIAQGYVDYVNALSFPIYTDKSGGLLDWIGSSIYGLPRPVIGNPTGAIYGSAFYGQEIYGSGSISIISATDDYYKRILTWKLHRGDGFYSNVEWLKRRIKRFIIGANGTSPDIEHTHEISVSFGQSNIITIVINYPSDQSSVDACIMFLTAGVLDFPYQYNFTVRSA
jgi:hypothetical protein